MALIAIAVHSRDIGGSVVTAAATGFYATSLFLWLLTLAFSYLRWPLPVSTGVGWRTRAALGLLIAVAIAALCGLGHIIWQQEISPTVYDARVAGLLVGLALMLRMLAAERPRSPLLDSLVRIRRSLGLGHIDVESARRQTDIALAGMTVGQVLQDELTQLLSLLGKAAAQMEVAATEIEGVRSAMPDDLAFSDDDKAALSGVLRSGRRRAADATALAQEARQIFEALKRRIIVLGRLVPGSREESVELLSRVQAGLDQAVAKAIVADEAVTDLGRLLGFAGEEGEDASVSHGQSGGQSGNAASRES